MVRPNDPQAPPGRPGRWLLRAAARLALALLLCVGLVLAGALALSLGWQRARLKAVVESRLSAVLGTPVRIGALRGPLLPRLEIDGLRVGPESSELARARRVLLRVALDSVPPAEPLVIEDLEIEGLELRLRRDESGWLLPPAADEGPPPAQGGDGDPPFAIELRRVRVSDSHVDLSWTHPESPGELVGGFESELHDVRIPVEGEPSFGPATLVLSLEHGALAGQRVDRGALEAALDAEHQLDFTAVTAGGFGEIGLQGRGDLDAWLASRIDPGTRVDLAFDRLDLEVLSGGRTPSTRLAGRAGLGVGERRSPDTGAPELAFDATLEPSRLGPVAVSEAELRGSLLDDAWQVDELSLRGEGLSLAGQLAGTGAVPRTIALQARVARLDDLSGWLELAGATPLEPGALSGSLSLDVQLAGPADRPEALAGRVAATVRKLAWRETTIGDGVVRARIEGGQRAVLETFELTGGRLPLAAEPGAVLRLAGGSLSRGVVVEGLRLRSQKARLAVDGRVGRDAVHDLHLQLAGLHPARVGALEGIAEPSAGRIDADLVLDGPLDRPQAVGWIALHDGAARIPVLGETFEPIEGRVRLEEEALVVERLTVGPPGARAALSGRIALSGLRPGRADLRLQVEDFPLTRVPMPPALSNGGSGEEAGGPEPTAVATGGRVDADLHLTGPLSAPAVSGRLDWSQPRWEQVQLEHIAVRLQADGSFVTGQLNVRYQGSEILSAEGRLPVPANPRVPLDWLEDPRGRIEIRGEALDFALLAPFLTRLVRDPRGRADLQIVVRGGRPEPSMNGELVVANGSIRVPLLRQTFAPVSGLAHFDGRRVRLEALSVGRPGAGLTAKGTLELSDLRPERIDLEIELDRFPASRSALVTANVDGHVALRGPVSAPALTGDLTLRDARITVRSSDAVAREIRVRASARDESLRETAKAERSLLDRASADLSITVPGDTWIRSAELELDVQGWARLEKRSLEPARYSGRLETRRGMVKVAGKRFELRRGEAILDGSKEIDPVLDVEGTHRVGAVRIIAYVTGRVSEPVLRLDSEPPMDEDEVASYLFFGRPPNQLGAREQGDVSLAAAGLAAGMALDELREMLGSDLPIDTIDVRIEEGDQPSRVELGKYVAKDVFVRFGQTFGAEAYQELGISYRITDHWLIESTTSSNATAGADVYWTIDY